MGISREELVGVGRVWFSEKDQTKLLSKYQDLASSDVQKRKQTAEGIWQELRSPKNALATMDLLYAAASEVDLTQESNQKLLQKAIQENPVIRESIVQDFICKNSGKKSSAKKTKTTEQEKTQSATVSGIDKLTVFFQSQDSRFIYESIIRQSEIKNALDAKALCALVLKNHGAAVAIFNDPDLSKKVATLITADDITTLINNKPEENDERWQHYLPMTLAFIFKYCTEKFAEVCNNPETGSIALAHVRNILFNNADKRPDIVEHIQQHPGVISLLTNNDLEKFIDLMLHSNDPVRFLRKALANEQQSEIISANIITFATTLKHKLFESDRNQQRVYRILDAMLKLKLADGSSVRQHLDASSKEYAETFSQVVTQEHIGLSHKNLVMASAIYTDSYFRKKVSLNNSQREQWQKSISQHVSNLIKLQTEAKRTDKIFSAANQLKFVMSDSTLSANITIVTNELIEAAIDPYLNARKEISSHRKTRKEFCKYFNKKYSNENPPSYELAVLIKTDHDLSAKFKEKTSIIGKVLAFLGLRTDPAIANKRSMDLIEKVIREHKEPLDQQNNVVPMYQNVIEASNSLNYFKYEYINSQNKTTDISEDVFEGFNQPTATPKASTVHAQAIYSQSKIATDVFEEFEQTDSAPKASTVYKQGVRSQNKVVADVFEGFEQSASTPKASTVHTQGIRSQSKITADVFKGYKQPASTPKASTVHAQGIYSHSKIAAKVFDGFKQPASTPKATTVHTQGIRSQSKIASDVFEGFEQLASTPKATTVHTQGIRSQSKIASDVFEGFEQLASTPKATTVHTQGIRSQSKIVDDVFDGFEQTDSTPKASTVYKQGVRSQNKVVADVFEGFEQSASTPKASTVHTQGIRSQSKIVADVFDGFRQTDSTPKASTVHTQGIRSQSKIVADVFDGFEQPASTPKASTVYKQGVRSQNKVVADVFEGFEPLASTPKASTVHTQGIRSQSKIVADVFDGFKQTDSTPKASTVHTQGIRSQSKIATDVFEGFEQADSTPKASTVHTQGIRSQSKIAAGVFEGFKQTDSVPKASTVYKQGVRSQNKVAAEVFEGYQNLNDLVKQSTLNRQVAKGFRHLKHTDTDVFEGFIQPNNAPKESTIYKQNLRKLAKQKLGAALEDELSFPQMSAGLDSPSKERAPTLGAGLDDFEDLPEMGSALDDIDSKSSAPILSAGLDDDVSQTNNPVLSEGLDDFDSLPAMGAGLSDDVSPVLSDGLDDLDEVASTPKLGMGLNDDIDSSFEIIKAPISEIGEGLDDFDSLPAMGAGLSDDISPIISDGLDDLDDVIPQTDKPTVSEGLDELDNLPEMGAALDKSAAPTMDGELDDVIDVNKENKSSNAIVLDKLQANSPAKFTTALDDIDFDDSEISSYKPVLKTSPKTSPSGKLKNSKVDQAEARAFADITNSSPIKVR